MEKFIEITDEDIAEVSKASVKNVADVFTLFIKTVKAMLVYPASSKLPHQFKESLFSSLTNLLEELDELTFKVESDSISYNENSVYQAKAKTENFAHPFFRDGILEFKFKRGLTVEELNQFVDIASQMTRSALVDDDAATLLWESGFEHISYELMDDFLDIETFEYGTDKLKTGQTPSETDLKGLFVNNIDMNLTEEDFDLNSEKNRSRRLPSAYLNVEDDVSRFITNIANYDESEKAAMAEMLAADVRFDHIKYAIDTLFEILNMETDNAGYVETLDLIAKVGTDFIKLGDYRSAVAIIGRAKELGQVLSKLDSPKHEKIQIFIGRFAASEKIKILVDHLNKAKDVNYAEVTAFLKMLPWQAVDPLVWALGELDHYPARRAICQALETLAVEHPDVLGKGTESPRWYVVRNVVSILGKIGDRRAFAYFKRSIQHPDIRVRKETVMSAARIISDEAGEFLITALQDQDEKIQMMALREIVERKIFVAFGHIGRVIANKEFKNRSADQIRELLAGFAVLGGAEAFEPLQKIIMRWSLMPSEKYDRLRIHAVRALGYIRTPEAMKLLEKIACSRNKKLVDIARRTLNKVKRGEDLV